MSRIRGRVVEDGALDETMALIESKVLDLFKKWRFFSPRFLAT